MKTSWLALGTISLGLGGLAGLVGACGGAESADVLGAPGQATASSSGTSGASGSSSSGTSGSSSSSSSSGNTSSSSSSGSPTDGCVPCPTPAPAGCSYPDPCSCTFTCEDAGGSLKCKRTATTDSCPANSYCDAPDCNTGVCVKKGTQETAAKDPQCGCNGVTYWNTSIAKKAGMAIRAGGACKGDQQPAFCGGIAPAACPSGASCNMQVKKDNCNQSDGQGTCWMLPTTCSTVVVGGNARPCGPSLGCSEDCQAIRKGISWYEDNSCPH